MKSTTLATVLSPTGDSMIECRETPYSGGKVSIGILGYMKIKRKKELTLGDLIAAAFQIWGADQAEKMVRFACKTRLVVFREHAHLFISSAKRRSA
jgi:hypothetical protein